MLFCFNYLPMYGVQIAFRDFSPSQGIQGSPWVGPANFQKFFNSFQSKNLIWNTVSLSLYSLIAGFPFPIILALMVNQIRVKRFKQVLQVVTYLPHFISTVVMVGIMLILLSPSNGIYGNLARVLGVQNPVNIMGEASAFQHVYPVVNYTAEQSEEIASLTVDIYKYVNETWASWIVNGGIDEQWDAYVDQLNQMGLERLMEIYQEALDVYNNAG